MLASLAADFVCFHVTACLPITHASIMTAIINLVPCKFTVHSLSDESKKQDYADVGTGFRQYT